MSELITGNWDDDAVTSLEEAVGNRTTVPYEDAVAIAEDLNRSVRSVTGKMRSMDITVGAKPTSAPTFSEAQTAALESFVTANSGELTYAEIAEQFPGDFTRPQIQGKILSMELNSHVAKTVREATPSKYSADEEDTIVAGIEAGDSLETITAALGGDHSMNSVRGKALSMFRQNIVSAVPKQDTTVSRGPSDYFADVDGDIVDLTVDEIADQLGKTPRGVKVALTKRGLSCADYTAKVKEAA